MSRDPAEAGLSSANQRIECFCRTRLFSTPVCWLIAGLLLCAGTVSFAVESALKGYVAEGVKPRDFTLDQAIRFAFQHNPDVLRARQEIRRTKGVQIEVRAEALPHLDADAFFRKTDPNLRGGNSSSIISSERLTLSCRANDSVADGRPPEVSPSLPASERCSGTREA